MNLIVVPQLSGGWQHNYSTQTREAGCANEQSMYSLNVYGLHGLILFLVSGKIVERVADILGEE